MRSILLSLFAVQKHQMFLRSEHETRCSSLLGGSDSDIMGLVIFVTRGRILLHPRLYPDWIPDTLSVPLDFFFTHPC